MTGSSSGDLEVELVEWPDDVRAPAPPTPPRGGAGRGRHRLGTAVAVAVAGLVVVGAQVAETAAGPVTAGVTEGLVEPVPAAPEELWHLTGSFWAEPSDGLVVLRGPQWRVEARTLRTGLPAWTEEESWAGECDVPRDPRGQATGSDLLLCVGVRDRATGQDESGPPRPTTTRLDVRSSADGRLLWTRDLPGYVWYLSRATGRAATSSGAPADATGVGDVVAVAERRGRVTVSRFDPDTGAERWSVAQDLATGPEGYGHVDALSGLLVVGGSWGVDLASGRSVDVGGDALFRWQVPVPGGTAVVTTSATEELRTAVHDRGGHERFAVAGLYPAGHPNVVSARADVVLLVGREGGAAVDVRTGEELWQLPAATHVAPVAYLQDMVVAVVGGRELVALDAVSGRERWRVGLTDRSSVAQEWIMPQVVVDDARILVGRTERGVDSLAAVDLLTGAVAWQLEVPSPVIRVRGAGGVLIVETVTGLHVLG